MSLDQITEEDAHRAASDLRVFLDNTGFLHDAEGPAEVKEICDFLLGCCREATRSKRTPSVAANLRQHRLAEGGDFLS
ncbi:hypothetical protein ACC685_34510 [Rhizobium ruizarguesonis]